jgi:uncharacterized membrane protein YkvI
MKLQIVTVILIITIGIIFTSTNMGSGGFITQFLAAFGLISLFILVLVIVFAKKQKNKK